MGLEGVERQMIRCGHCQQRKPASEFYNQTKWCKECRKADERRRRRDPTLRARYRHRYETDLGLRAAVICNRVKKRAKAEGVPFDLTVNWVFGRLLSGTCEVSGLPFDMTCGRDAPRGPSVDRITPGAKGGGYTQSNCRMVTNLVNSALMVWGEGALIEMARAVVARHPVNEEGRVRE